MHADLSRLTFRPERHYSAVVAQQGRVQLDADTNEQTLIGLARIRALTAELIGRHGGPAGDLGFAVRFEGGRRDLDSLDIGGGRYYVDGIELDSIRPAPGEPVPDDGADADDDTAPAPAPTWSYWDQPDAYRDPEVPGDRLPGTFPFLVYLKVWERLVTAAEDPGLREVALGPAMPDTSARVKVVWQVLATDLGRLGLDGDGEPDAETVTRAFRAWADQQETPAAKAAFRAERPGHGDEDPCLVAPDDRYRGPENQLYRVEIHDGGTAKEATFKWSRENGSVIFPVDELDGTWVELAHLGGDGKLGLDVGDRVEFVDSAYAARLEPLPLLRVEELDLPGHRVRLSDEPQRGIGRRADRHPYLRRWDHRDGYKRTEHGAGAKLKQGALAVEEGRWLLLEDGVEVYFAKGGTYRTGENWIVPARTATGSVEWPEDTARRPLLRPPLGIVTHHAPLTVVTGEGSQMDLRRQFTPLGAPVPAASQAELALEARAREEELAAESAAGEGRAGGRSQTTAEAEDAVGPGGERGENHG